MSHAQLTGEGAGRQVRDRGCNRTNVLTSIYPLSLTCLLIASAFELPSTPVENFFRNLVHRNWTTANGLPQNTVYCLTQTRDGYLWIGTDGGLVRFDGSDFKVFTKENTPAIGVNGITALCQDQRGTLWIGTYGGGLSYLREGLFFRSDQLGSDFIWTLTADSQGGLWIGTVDRGACRLQAGNLMRMTTEEGLPSNTVLAIVEDFQGRIWLGGDQGLCRIDRGSKRIFVTSDGLGNGYILALHEDRDLVLWIGTDSGLTAFRNDSFQRFSTNDGLIDNRVRSIWEDGNRNLWIGTDKGICVKNGQRFVSLPFIPDVAGNSVMAGLEDRDKNIWVGTAARGLNRIWFGNLNTITTRDGLSGDQVRAVYQDRQGVLWVGTYGHGLNRYRQGRWSRVPIPARLGCQIVNSLCQDREGGLWLGCENGLIRLQSGKPRFFNLRNGLASDHITSLFEDRQGNLWIGTARGLHLFRKGVLVSPNLENGLPSAYIQAISQDRRGDLWVGTFRQGLYRRQQDRWRLYNRSDGLQAETIYAVHVDADDRIWLGSDGSGLILFQDGRFFSMTSRAGLFDDRIYSVLEDREQNLWLSSNRGIFSIGKEEIREYASGRIPELHCQVFGEEEGMKSSVCAGGFQPAAWRTVDGKMLFPTLKGLVQIDLSQAVRQQRPPTVSIAEIVVEGVNLPVRSELVLPAGTMRVDIGFGAICFNSPQQLKFFYRLEGYDRAWIPAGNRRHASYSNLSPGNYSFLVATRGVEGNWNPNRAMVSFILRAYFHQTAWFFLLLALAAGGGVGALWHLRHKFEKEDILEKYRASTLSSEKAEAYLKRLLELMENEKPFLDADLTLTALADRLAIPGKHLSQIINEKLMLNFNDFINSYRITEAKKKLADPREKGAKLLKIAFEVGFNSKSVFNAAFKKHTGMKPSQFRRTGSD